MKILNIKKDISFSMKTSSYLPNLDIVVMFENEILMKILVSTSMVKKLTLIIFLFKESKFINLDQIC